jgi:V8-like Glu-specific endopeptidase
VKKHQAISRCLGSVDIRRFAPRAAAFSLGFFLTAQAGINTALAEEKAYSSDREAVPIIHNNSQEGLSGQFYDDGGLFTTREERLRVKPMEWSDAPAPELDSTYGNASEGYLKPETPEGPAGSSAGGKANPKGDADAEYEFLDAWEGIKEIDRRKKEAGSSEGSMESFGAGTDSTPTLNAPSRESNGTSFEDGNFDGFHGVFTRYLGNHNTQMWRSPPWNKVGKLYFTTPSGGTAYCTANLVSSKSIIATAAHCVYTRGQGFNRNFRFVPAERYGYAPYGSFGWSSATVPPKWVSNGGRRWDLGLIKLRNNSSGKSATYYLGWLGLSWNWGYTQLLHSIGYASNLSTQVTNICSAQSFHSALEGDDVLVKGCDMTYGSSGGGWIKDYEPYSHGQNYVDAVVSGPHTGAFGTTYVGPRFSSSNLLLICSVFGGC